MSTTAMIMFDVNETLSGMSPRGEAFDAAGAPAELARMWFAGILRDSFATAAAGGNAAFSQIVQDSLVRLLTESCDAVGDAAAGTIISALKNLEAPPPTWRRASRPCAGWLSWSR